MAFLRRNEPLKSTTLQPRARIGGAIRYETSFGVQRKTVSG